MKEEMTKNNISSRLIIDIKSNITQFDLINEIAKKSNVPFTIAAYNLLKNGMDRCDNELKTTILSNLFDKYVGIVDNYKELEQIYIIVEVERYLVMKIRLRAAEYGYDTDYFSYLIIANEIENI